MHPLVDKYRHIFAEYGRLHHGDGTTTLSAFAADLARVLSGVALAPAVAAEPVPAESPYLGYTGDACGHCGSMRMRRTGTCSVCEDCGQSGGC